MTGAAVIAATTSGRATAERLSQFLKAENVDTSAGVALTMRERFASGHPIVAVMASGAAIRILAPLLLNKRTEPPVVCVADDGSSVVPLLGGHHGANTLARKIARELGVDAAVTTAGDLRFGVALDEPPAGWALANPDAAKSAMAAALGGATFSMGGLYAEHAGWLAETDFPLAVDGNHMLRFDTSIPTDDTLTFAPKVHCLGVGCERGANAEEIALLIRETLAEADISLASVAGVWSLDLKADEAGLHRAVRGLFDAPPLFFGADTLNEQRSRLANPSDVVFAEVGCYGVAEGAALAAAGPHGELIVEKQKSKRATVAVARASEPMVDVPGRAQGSLAVVGIGPGSDEWRSPAVSRLVANATDLVGYSLYLDLLGPLAEGRTRHDYDLGAEELRVRKAMELAGEGRDVALVCSGDAGIYAMATLVFELLASDDLPDSARRIAIEVSPGISALQAAAARAGAPLGHDFCTISLSDLLTPWDDIQRRVKAAAEGDFVIAFYNPVSKRRRTQLAHARDVLLQHRPADTPVILATNLGRDGEAVRVVPLSKLNVDDVDMLTVVIVGSSNTEVTRDANGREWVYTPRGYSAKPGTRLGSTK